MEERILQFIAALRGSGVRISLAESADALQAIDYLGVQDRETFRLSLLSTLIKDSNNMAVFDELFPLFFGADQHPPLADLSEDLTEDEAKMLAQALRQFKDQIRQLLERLIRGDQLSEEELEELNQLVGLDQMKDMRYRDWLTRRMEQALRFPEVREALKELMEAMAQMGMNKERVEQLSKLLHSNQKALEEQLKNYAGQKIAENISQSPPEDSVDGLLNRPFNTLSDRDLDRLRKEVRRLANALRTRLALRHKRAKTGQLDAKSTIRANLRHGNVPIDIKHKDHHLKPRIVVVCDISTSMRPCSELMLSLIYAIQDQLSKTHSFAFIDHLEYISPEFSSKDSRQAVTTVLERMPPGHYNTDLGRSLEDFTKKYLDLIDSRSTFIVVGDGRNNHNDPRLDLVKLISRRSNRLIWLNPEAPTLWGTGDSDMPKYYPFCDSVFKVSNLAELTAAVDRFLS
jgi:uncharacterized protein